MSEIATSEVTEYDDGRFVRTAIVIPDSGASFDLVNMKGTRVAVVNAFVNNDATDTTEVEHLIVDVVDIDGLFGNNTALTFIEGERKWQKATSVVSADFRKLED